MNEKYTFGVVGLLLGVILTWIFATTAVNTQNSGMMGMMGMGNMMSRNSSQNIMGNIDQHFIEQMIPHHDDAIAMAHIAAEKAEHLEIKNLAEDITRTQSEENNQMKQWYKNWFGKDVPDAFAGTSHSMGSGMMHGGMMGDITDITKLENASPFDKEFIEQMIPHHQMAVMMAEMLKNSTTRPEMKQLAENIIEAQNREINQMRTWYAEWHK